MDKRDVDKYEIGARLFGHSKEYIKSLTCKIVQKFDLDYYAKKDIVPHLTFIRPFSTENEGKLIDSFENILRKYSDWPIIFNMKSFGFFNNKEKVFYVNVEKNSTIEEMIQSLEHSLNGEVDFFYPKIRLPEEKDSINLHCSIVDRGVNKYPREIQNFLDKQDFGKFKHPLLRVYLLKNDCKKKLILREFDFYLNECLERMEAIDPSIFERTLEMFKRKTGMELNKEGIILPIVKDFS